MRLRSCMAGCFFGAPVCAAKWPLGRLRGYPRCVGFVSKSPRSNQKKRKGRTADVVGRRPILSRPRVNTRHRPGPHRCPPRTTGTATRRAGRVGHLDVTTAARLLVLVLAVGTRLRAAEPVQRHAYPPNHKAHHAPPSQPRVNLLGYKQRSRLLRGYEHDPAPPPTVCVSKTTPTRRGQSRDSLASQRTGHGRRRTHRSTSAQAQASATCPARLLNPDT